MMIDEIIAIIYKYKTKGQFGKNFGSTPPYILTFYSPNLVNRSWV